MWLPIDWAKGPSSSSSLPPLFSQCESHGPPIGVGREKKDFMEKKVQLLTQSVSELFVFIDWWFYKTSIRQRYEATYSDDHHHVIPTKIWGKDVLGNVAFGKNNKK